MTDLRKAAEMALEFVEWLCGDDHSVKPKNNALKTREALRQALAQPPCQTGSQCIGGKCPECEWVGLTDEELKVLCDEWQIIYGGYVRPFAETIEAKLKEKNSG